MTKNRLLPIIIVASLLLTGKLQAQPSPSDSLIYRMVSFSKEFGQRGDSLWCCAHLKASYPIVLSGADQAVIDSINKYYNKTLAAIGFTAEVSDWDDRADQVFSTRTNLLNAPSTATTDIGTDVTTLVILNGQGLFTTVTLKISYFGGKPILARMYANFSLETGKRLTLADLFPQANRSLLEGAGERAFRELLEVPDGATLASRDINFPEDKFELPDGFLIKPSGLEFHFARNEVIPREIQLTIPWADLNDLLKPNCPVNEIIQNEKGTSPPSEH